MMQEAWEQNCRGWPNSENRKYSGSCCCANISLSTKCLSYSLEEIQSLESSYIIETVTQSANINFLVTTIFCWSINAVTSFHDVHPGLEITLFVLFVNYYSRNRISVSRRIFLKFYFVLAVDRQTWGNNLPQKQWPDRNLLAGSSLLSTQEVPKAAKKSSSIIFITKSLVPTLRPLCSACLQQ